MALTFAIGMALGSLICLTTFYITMSQSTNQENTIDGKYQIELKRGSSYASADLVLKKKIEESPNVRRR